MNRAWVPANLNMKNLNNSAFAFGSVRLCRAAFLLLLAGGLVLAAPLGGGAHEWNPQRLGEPLLRDPIWVYNNWSAYDELSDRIPLTEELAMRELAQCKLLAVQ